MHTAVIPASDEVSVNRARGSSIASISDTISAIAALPAVLDGVAMATISVVAAREDAAMAGKATAAAALAGTDCTTLISEKLKDVLLPCVAVREINADDDSSSSCSTNGTDDQDDGDVQLVIDAGTAATPAATLGIARSTKTTTIAFAFDIDGVLLRSKTPVPGASDTIMKLQRLQIPFILLTNGGGHTEAAHVAQLGDRLGLPSTKSGDKGCLTEDQFVQSHTPFRDLVGQYGDKTILALGGAGNGVRTLAEAYGFTKVVTSSDVLAAEESVHPFSEMTRKCHLEHARPLVHDRDTHSATGADLPMTKKPEVKISAIMVFSSPRDWCLDLQLVVDLLLSSRGVLGTRSSKNGDKTLPNRGFLQDDQPKLFFCNPDFEWATSNPLPRFAQGAFREALEGVWRFATRGPSDAGGGGQKGEGVKLEYTICGKPTDTTYVYGERVLQAHNERLLQDELELQNVAINAEKSQSFPRRDITHVYMIGDNPESDITGANSYTSRFGAQWKSILVETGVYVAGTTPAHKPDHITRDVQSAVDWALAQHEDVE